MVKKKNVLITGVTGQDGAYLAKFLLKKDTMFLVRLEELQPPIFGDCLI